MEKIVRNNKILSVVAAALRTAALLCATGALMQTFLAELGFSQEEIYIQSTLLQAANVITILLGARFADRGNLIRRTAVVVLATGVFYLTYLPLCLARSTDTVVFVYLLLMSIGQAICTALHTVCEYKIPYFVYRREEYGTVTALIGILGSGISFAIGALMTALSAKFDYIWLMFWAFIASALFMALSAFLQLKLRSLIDMDAVQESGKSNGKKRIPLLQVFRHPAFSHLAVAHFLRGVAGGVTNVLAVVALGIGFDTTVTTAMVSVSSVAILAACAVYGISAKYIHPRYVIFVGSMMVLALPLLFVVSNPILFLGIYAFILFGRTFVDYAVPTAMVYVVPVEIAGPYNAWRMVLNNGGMLFATGIAVFIPDAALIWVAFACSLVSGLFYLLAGVMRNSSRARSGV